MYFKNIMKIDGARISYLVTGCSILDFEYRILNKEFRSRKYLLLDHSLFLVGYSLFNKSHHISLYPIPLYFPHFDLTLQDKLILASGISVI